MKPDVQQVKAFLLQLQDAICAKLSAVDGKDLLKIAGSAKAAAADAAGFYATAASLSRPGLTSLTSMAMRCPPQLPPTARNWPGAALRRWAFRWWCIRATPMCRPATLTFAFLLPRSPAPTRCGGSAAGLDLTPYYGFEEDAIHWHRTARDYACRTATRSIRAIKSGAMITSSLSTVTNSAALAVCSLMI